MEFPSKRPFLVLSKLVEQPTWGGAYIGEYKQIKDPDLRSKKIGQSYELYGKSILSLATDTSDSQFQSDFIDYNKTGAVPSDEDCMLLDTLVAADPKGMLGPIKQNKMPLLIKFTQALGNSFQLHVKKPVPSLPWQPKPESWYFLEDGIVTFGIKKGADMAKYKAACFAVEEKIKNISEQIKAKKMDYKRALEEIAAIMKAENLWQFVNIHRVKKHAAVDLSAGGIHHSWEEDPATHPQGNIVYEVQLDVTDETSTLRSFDKGKMKSDGTIRELQIEEYFKNLDVRPESNDLSLALQKKSGASVFQTPHYCLDAVTLSKETISENATSFAHLFVLEGTIEVETSTHTIEVGKGHSCFIPYAVNTYSLTPLQGNAAILKTYIK